MSSRTMCEVLLTGPEDTFLLTMLYRMTSIYGICETWLYSSFQEAKLFLDNFTPVRSKRCLSTKPGGVLIAVGNTSSFEISNLDLQVSCCATTISVSGIRTFTLVSLQTPSNSQYISQTVYFQSIFSCTCQSKCASPVIVIDDFNRKC